MFVVLDNNRRVPAMLHSGSAALSILLAACASSEPLTICEAADANLLQDSASLRLVATYSTDGAQVAFFRDAGCPSVRVRLLFDEGDVSSRRFLEEISSKAGPGEAIQRYTVDVSGVYYDEFGGRDHMFVVDRVNRYVPAP